jgi:hypothetical protein
LCRTTDDDHDPTDRRWGSLLALFAFDGRTIVRLPLLVLVLGVAVPGFLGVVTSQETFAGSAMRPLLKVTASPDNPHFENVYYYRGRYYRYRYRGAYYTHRYYRGNRWHYY